MPVGLDLAGLGCQGIQSLVQRASAVDLARRAWGAGWRARDFNRALLKPQQSPEEKTSEPAKVHGSEFIPDVTEGRPPSFPADAAVVGRPHSQNLVAYLVAGQYGRGHDQAPRLPWLHLVQHLETRAGLNLTEEQIVVGYPGTLGIALLAEHALRRTIDLADHSPAIQGSKR